MAKRAIVAFYSTPFIDNSDDYGITAHVCYGENGAYTQEEVIVTLPWSTLMAANGYEVAVRNAVIAAQPSGFDLSNADVAIVSIRKGSLV